MVQPKQKEILSPTGEALDSNVINHIDKRFSDAAPKDYIVRELNKEFKSTSLITFTPEEFEIFKREFGKELLELAANKAKTKIRYEYISKYDNYETYEIIDRESITFVLDDYLLNNKI